MSLKDWLQSSDSSESFQSLQVLSSQLAAVHLQHLRQVGL